MIKDIVFTVFHPSYWLMNEPFSESWDEVLNKLLEKYAFEPCCERTVKLNGIRIWVANHPFASMTPYGQTMPSFRPKRRTIARAFRKMQSDIFKPMETKQKD